MLKVSADIQTHWSEPDLALVHGFLSRETYWAAGIPRATLERALANSVCYGGYVDGQLVAFARAISDKATFAYLADVFVLPDHRGRGYARTVVTALMD
ncbi:MAG: GNAT family N-acetyltransferase, partial [Lysobacter sp.]